MGYHLHIGMLSYSAAPAISTMNSVLFSMPLLEQAGWKVSLSGRCGDSFIPRARNSILAEFLSREADYLLMLDDDVSWKPEQLVRFLSHPVDVVAGMYRYKMDEENYPIRWLNGEIWIDKKTLLWEVESVPAGFLRLSRACILKMVEAYKDREFHDTVTDLNAHALFDFELHDKAYWGEDYTFCRRWREIGGKVYVDQTLELEHHGRKAYTGCIGEWLSSLPPDKFHRPQLEAAE